MRNMRIRRLAFALGLGLGAAAVASCASSGAGEGLSDTDGSADDGGSEASVPDDATSGQCDANLMTDWTHCGSCTNVCATGQVCNSGVCQQPCAVPLSNCPNQTQCFDLTSDINNCGTCGTSCVPPQGGTVQCSQSSCVYTCPADAGVTACAASNGAPAGCFDLTSSTQHCGSCGTQCTSTQSCNSGVCCAQNSKLCGSTCIDVSKDPNNCGDCGKVCPSTGVCTGGKCLGYTVSSPTGVFVDACSLVSPTTVLPSSGGWNMSDAISLPFPFTFYGAAQTQVFAGDEGTVGFGMPMGYVDYPDCNNGNPFTTYAALVPYGDRNP